MSISDLTDRDIYPVLLPQDPDVHVSVYDGKDRLLWHGQGGSREDMQLPRGLYTVRLEANNRIEEKIVRLTEARNLKGFNLRSYSAAPLEGMTLSHEYFSDPANRISKTATRPPVESVAPNDASVFLFLRTVDRDQARQFASHLGANLHLRDHQGNVVTRFADDEVQRDTNYGWMAFSVEAPHGLYRLVHTASPKREVPIYLYPGFQTQVFIIQRERPLLEGMRIFMQRPGAGFDPGSYVARVADQAMEGFMNRSTHLPQRAEGILVNAKFENPVFGLIGAYTLVRQLRTMTSDQTDVTADGVRMLDTVIGNLETLIPGCPDVGALSILRNELLGKLPEMDGFRDPPMFRMGLEAVFRAAAGNENLVANASLLDRVTMRLIADSPWTSWEPLPARRSGEHSRSSGGRSAIASPPELPLGIRSKQRVFSVLGGPQSEQPMSFSTEFQSPVVTLSGSQPARKAVSAPNWVQAAFLNALQSMQGRLRRSNRIAETPSVSIYDLARQTGTTPRSVMRAVKKLDAYDMAQRSELLGSDWEELRSVLTSGESPPSFSQLLTWPLYLKEELAVEAVTQADSNEDRYLT